jgi:RNA:NAD 2'-phosphotransferase (TPT1/KptA family)
VRMKRQWVHLSSDWLAALRAGLRKPSPVLLRTTFASSSFYHAGGTTWLAPEVPTEGLEVVPLYEVFRWVQLAPSLPIGRG